MSTLKRAIFLDRDGTINRDTGYVGLVEDFTFLPHAIRGLQQLRDLGYLLFIVTNQSGVARGYFSLDDVHAIHDLMCGALTKKKIKFEEIYICPDMAGEPSQTRKPSPYFLLDAEKKYGIDLANSWMIGDKVSDCETGRRAGTGVIQILGEYDRDEETQHFCKNLVDAAKLISSLT